MLVNDSIYEIRKIRRVGYSYMNRERQLFDFIIYSAGAAVFSVTGYNQKSKFNAYRPHSAVPLSSCTLQQGHDLT